MAAPAAAHVTVDAEAQSAAVGDWFLYFTSTPGVVHAGERFLLVLSVTTSDFAAAEGLDVGLETPWGAFTMEETSPGRYVAPLVAHVTGTHTLAISLREPDAEPLPWSPVLTVYPDLGVTLTPTEPAADYYQNETYDIGVLALNRSTEEPDPRVVDLSARFEHWTSDHRTLLYADEVAGVGDGDTWRFGYTFRDEGMFHIRFSSASLGMGWNDTPYLHVYAIRPLGDVAAPDPEPVESPGAGALLLLAAGAAAAMLGRAGRRR